MQETFYEFSVPLMTALVADLHDQPYSEVLHSLRNQKPDIICVAGDFTHGGFPSSGLKMESTQYALSFLQDCSSVAPVFVSLGNHEWLLCEQDLAAIRSTGATVLENSFVRYQNVLIGGLTSARFTAYREFREGFPSETYPRPFPSDTKKMKPDLSWLNAFEALPDYKILLSHHPEYYISYLQDRKINLILSGHAHGGQIRLFGHGIFAPGQGLLPKYTSGVHQNLVISRGLANTAFVPRLFNPTELVYLVPASQQLSEN